MIEFDRDGFREPEMWHLAVCAALAGGEAKGAIARGDSVVLAFRERIAAFEAREREDLGRD